MHAHTHTNTHIVAAQKADSDLFAVVVCCSVEEFETHKSLEERERGPSWWPSERERGREGGKGKRGGEGPVWKMSVTRK